MVLIFGKVLITVSLLFKLSEFFAGYLFTFDTIVAAVGQGTIEEMVLAKLVIGF